MVKKKDRKWLIILILIIIFLFWFGIPYLLHNQYVGTDQIQQWLCEIHPQCYVSVGTCLCGIGTTAAVQTDSDQDSDGDGWTDQQEANHGTNPNDPNDNPGSSIGIYQCCYADGVYNCHKDTCPSGSMEMTEPFSSISACLEECYGPTL